MMFRSIALVLPVIATLACGQPVQAQVRQSQAVVELFTSQGCSSCPPADALLSELARDPALIALTLPVDYWDYLGWKDTLAQPAFTARQKGYAHLRGDGQVYTPQVVVNGNAHVVGSDRGAIQDAARASVLPAQVKASEVGGTIKISVSGSEVGKGAAVLLLPVMRGAQVSILRGENKNRKITYANVVRGVTRIGDWNGGEATFEVPLAALSGPGHDGYVILVQSMMPKANGMLKAGPILGAYRSPGL